MMVHADLNTHQTLHIKEHVFDSFDNSILSRTRNISVLQSGLWERFLRDRTYIHAPGWYATPCAHNEC